MKLTRYLVATTLALGVLPTQANDYNYALNAKKVADNTYVFIGKTEDFSRKNGGNIVNTGFIITDDSVVVIDSGPSRRYAEQQKAAIESLTDKPIKRVYLTHHHPDHFFGNQVYKEEADLFALAKTNKAIQAEGEMFSGNMYRLVGDWMRGTGVVVAEKTVKAGKETIGGHELEFIEGSGHTAGDLMVFDHSTGVLFVGDLVFNQRAATTPHANIKQWLKTLDKIQALPFKVMVVGHGETVMDKSAIEQTRDYLTWLERELEEGAKQGMDMTEVMQIEIPERFQSVALVRDELQRSVTHLFPKFEEQQLNVVNE